MSYSTNVALKATLVFYLSLFNDEEHAFIF